MVQVLGSSWRNRKCSRLTFQTGVNQRGRTRFNVSGFMVVLMDVKCNPFRTFHFTGKPIRSSDFPQFVSWKCWDVKGVLRNQRFAGGIGFGPGTLMAITDHINMTGRNLMRYVSTPAYPEIAHKVADKLGIKWMIKFTGVTGLPTKLQLKIHYIQDYGTDAVGNQPLQLTLA